MIVITLRRGKNSLHDAREKWEENERERKKESQSPHHTPQTRVCSKFERISSKFLLWGFLNLQKKRMKLFQTL